MSIPEDFIIVYVNTDSKSSADLISHSIVQEKLAACVNIISNVESVYIWNEKAEQTTEFTLLIKSKSSLFEELSARITELHHYEVPEIIAVPLQYGNPAYLNWMQSCMK